MLRNVAMRALVGAQTLLRTKRGEDGQTLAEYGLIMSIISVFVIVSAVAVFGDAIEASFLRAADCLDGTCP